MADGSTIEWLKRPGTKPATWNPVRGCTRVSRGCGGAHNEGGCYAEVLAARFSLSAAELEAAWLANPPADAMAMPTFKDQWGHGFAETIKKPDGTSVRRWTGKVELIEEKLPEPLRWKSPRTIFVNSTSDLFHEKLPGEAIDRIFAVMALCPQHTFLILTKRPERMRAYVCDPETPTRIKRVLLGERAHHFLNNPPSEHPVIVGKEGDVRLRHWPFPNVWLGTSTEDQATYDERSEHLHNTPAAIHFFSMEPLLGPIVADYLGEWVIIGGESGAGARLHDVSWDRSIIAQCRAAGVAVFEKQLGSQPVDSSRIVEGDAPAIWTRDKKGGDISEWPADLRVREWPEARAA